MSAPGLTPDQLVRVAGNLVPTDRLGELLRQLPAKFYDAELQLYRPITPAILAAMDLDADADVLDALELAACDPDGAGAAWALLDDGSPLFLDKLLAAVAQQLAKLYSSKKPARTRVA